MASFVSQARPDFSRRLAHAQPGSQKLRGRFREKNGQNIITLPSMDPKPENWELETQVHKLIEDSKCESVDVQRVAMSELRILTKHMENRVVIANCGAISLLISLLYSTDLGIQENAVTALLNLSINDEIKAAIAAANVIDPLVHVLETGNVKAKENSAAALFNLSSLKELLVRIGCSGAIKPLVELLENGSPQGKKDAIRALFSLSILTENKPRIVEAGAVRPLVALMDPALGMVDKAVAILANLATVSEAQMAIGREGGIPALVEVVELGSAREKENAAAVLLRLCMSSKRFCRQVLREGAVPPLAALSQSGTSRAKEKARSLLCFFRNTGRV